MLELSFRVLFSSHNDITVLSTSQQTPTSFVVTYKYHTALSHLIQAIILKRC